MLKTLLKQKNKSIYVFAKECEMSYSTMHYIVSGKTPYTGCSVQFFKKMADVLEMSMDELYEVCQSKKDDEDYSNDGKPIDKSYLEG